MDPVQRPWANDNMGKQRQEQTYIGGTYCHSFKEILIASGI